MSAQFGEADSSTGTAEQCTAEARKRGFYPQKRLYNEYVHLFIWLSDSALTQTVIFSVLKG